MKGRRGFLKGLLGIAGLGLAAKVLPKAEPVKKPMSTGGTTYPAYEMSVDFSRHGVGLDTAAEADKHHFVFLMRAPDGTVKCLPSPPEANNPRYFRHFGAFEYVPKGEQT